MSQLGKIIAVACLLVVGGATYAASTIGLGMSTLKDKTTMEEIKKNCPDYYTNRNGECLRSTYRGLYFLYLSRPGGGFGSGK